MKRQITDSISENLTDSDLESIDILFELKKAFQTNYFSSWNQIFFLSVLYLNRKNIFLNKINESKKNNFCH